MTDLQGDQIGLIEKSGRQDDIDFSVIVVCFHAGKNIIQCLEALSRQDFDRFETIVVDNGGNEVEAERIRTYPVTYVKMKVNVGCSLGKNIGAQVARGQLIGFVDDDGIPAPGFVRAHIQSYTNPKIVGVRGKVLPREKHNLLNGLAYHYDLGETPIPAFIDTETNASFRKDVFFRNGGFNSSIIRGDGEGFELSYRIVKESGDPEVLLYNPEAIVFHDYADSLRKFITKALLQPKSSLLLEQKYPDIQQFIRQYPGGSPKVHVPHDFTTRIKVFLLRRVNRWLRATSRAWYSHSLKP